MPIVLFLTDGLPTVGQTSEKAIREVALKSNPHERRIFTFGVGDDLNTHFLDKLTEATRAARTYVTEKEDLEIPVSSFFEKIKSPVMVDVAIEYGNGIRAMQTYPRDLPDLFKGSQLVILGRYRLQALRDVEVVVAPVFVALVDDEMKGERPVGTASLVADDMSDRPELTPWLASVFVLPEWRGQGIASRLVQRVEAEACANGIGYFYLYTPDQQALYRRLGWRDRETRTYRGEAVTIMDRRLDAE